MTDAKQPIDSDTALLQQMLTEDLPPGAQSVLLVACVVGIVPEKHQASDEAGQLCYSKVTYKVLDPASPEQVRHAVSIASHAVRERLSQLRCELSDG